jgi:hypothetical protein
MDRLTHLPLSFNFMPFVLIKNIEKWNRSSENKKLRYQHNFAFLIIYLFIKLKTNIYIPCNACLTK